MTSIFLIEHDLDFAKILRCIFSAEGFDVSWAQTIDEAIPKVADSLPSITFVDLHDGDSVKLSDLEKFKKQLDDVPILVAANYKIPDLACKALSIGARDFILKPFGTKEILDRVQSLIGTGSIQENTRFDEIASSIHAMATIDDILNVTLDQLTGSLHLDDCLIALETDGSFSVAVAKGYKPDPRSRTIPVSAETTGCLSAQIQDPLELATTVVREVTDALGIQGHAPFPIIMPLLIQADESSDLLGFVMGHGSFILEEQDLFEMERFLSQVAIELAEFINKGESANAKPSFDIDDEVLIPEVTRAEATEKILEHVQSYYSDESDRLWIRLALDEAINNAIIHGHGEPIGNPIRNLKVKYSIGPEQFVFVVEDQGDGFDHMNLPDPTADENLMNINGRGIFLMRNIMDHVYFNERGNQVSLVKINNGKPLRPRV